MASAAVLNRALIKADSSNHNHYSFQKLVSIIFPKKEIITIKKKSHLRLPQPIPQLTSTENRGEEEIDMARIVSRFDEDGDGKISPAELRNCMLALGEDLTIEEAEAAVELIDSDGDGMLGLEDFMKLVSGEEDGQKGNNLKQAFRVYELEGEGLITPKSLREALGRLGERKTVEECEVMIRRFDLDRDGALSFEEFKMMMV